MSDLVLLKCDIGSKAATGTRPECGRVSRQILSASYSPSCSSLAVKQPAQCETGEEIVERKEQEKVVCCFV